MPSKVSMRTLAASRFRSRPQLFVFEDRVNPATFNVTITADIGAGSLRDAVNQANVAAGEDTITFAPGLGDVVLTSAELFITDTTGATTITGPATGTQVVTRSTAGGTPEFRIFGVGAGATANFSGLTISNAKTDFGGGIDNAGTVTLTNSTLSANTATIAGGGIFNGGTLTVTNSTLSANTSSKNGGGIFNNGTATVTLTNSTLSGNTANDSGGGILIASGTTATLSNSTLTANTASTNGGGIFNNGTLTLTNTIVAGNLRGTTAEDVFGPAVGTSANNLIGVDTKLTGITNGTQGNLIGTAALPIDAKLGALANNGGPTFTHALLAGSPAINAGSNAATGALTIDQTGAARTRFVTVDIGAFEFNTVLPDALVVDNTGDRFDGDFTAGQLTLREAVLIANEVNGSQTITFAPSLGDVALTSEQLVITDTTGATTITGPATGTQVVTRSKAVGTPEFRIFGVDTGATANFSGLTISNGKTEFSGGGIAIESTGTLTLTNSTLSANETTNGAGGAIFNLGTLTLTNSTLSANTATNGSGGAIFNNGTATLTLTNSTLSANTANGSGGGIVSNTGTTATLTNSTVTANTAGNGGGIRSLGTVTLTNTIIAGNLVGTTADDVNGAVVNTSANNLIGVDTNLTGITNGTQGNLIGGLLPIDAKVGALANNGGPTFTHALLAGSPAINAGTLTGAPSTDQRGFLRPGAANTPVDIGAFEVQSPLAVNDKATTAFNTATTIDVLANDSDPAGDLFTLTSVGPAANGTPAISNGKVTYTPNATFSGTNSFTYTITNSLGASATATVTVTVNAAPVNPRLVGYPQFAVGADAGTSPRVRTFNPDGTERTAVTVFDENFRGGVRTAAADFTGDGIADTVVGTGPGIVNRVRVLDGVTGAELFAISPFDDFRAGVFVSVGDITGDGRPDLCITPDEGGGPRVRLISGAGFTQILGDFFGIDDPAFRGGARSAIGDLDGDGFSELIVSAGFGGGPRITVWRGSSLASGMSKGADIANFFAFESALRNGSYVAAGDVDGDGRSEIIFGAGPGGGPRVRIFDGPGILQSQGKFNNLDEIGGFQRANFFGGDVNGRGGIRVAVKNLDGDNRADVIVGAGIAAGSRVTSYTGAAIGVAGVVATPTAGLDFDAFPGFGGGVFVG